MSAEEAERIGEEGARRCEEEAMREADLSWRDLVNGELEGSSGETMTITLDAVMTQRMKAASLKFGKSAEEFLMPFLHMVTAGAICYPLDEWEHNPARPVHTVEDIERWKEMG
jgi:hypothetical protein